MVAAKPEHAVCCNILLTTVDLPWKLHWAWGMNRVANQGLIFIFKVFSPSSWIKCSLIVYDTLAHGSAFRVQLELIWFIVHALLKRYSYLQHCRKSPSQGALRHPDSLTQTFIPRGPTHSHQWHVRVRFLKLGSCWGRIVGFSIFLGKEKSTGGAFGHHDASDACVLTHGS